jgi:hypothetical protein
MKQSRRDLLRLAAAAPALSLTAGSAFAQADYPNKNITAICMFPAGTGG